MMWSVPIAEPLREITGLLWGWVMRKVPALVWCRTSNVWKAAPPSTPVEFRAVHVKVGVKLIILVGYR